MSSLETIQLEQSERAWNIAAQTYEKAFIETSTGALWREAVWMELDRAFLPGSRVLEMNCGTGVDAIHLASHGVSVCACDISSVMVERATKGAVAAGVDGLLEFHVLATENLDQLAIGELFDGAFSNFSGLNCVSDLSAVSDALAARLKPRAIVLLCMLSSSPNVERFWRRIRRVFGNNEKSCLDRSHVTTQVQVTRYSFKDVEAAFEPFFQFHSRKGIGIFVPPAFLDDVAARYPRTVRMLGLLDRFVAKMPFFRDHGCCILLEFEKNGWC